MNGSIAEVSLNLSGLPLKNKFKDSAFKIKKQTMQRSVIASGAFSIFWKMDDLRRYYSFYRDVNCIWGLLTIKCHYWAQDKLACVCVENPGQLVHAAGANNGGFHYSSAKIRIWTLGMLIYYFTSRNYILPILITDWTLERSDNLLSVALCSWLNITLVFTYPPHSPLSKFGIVCRFSMCSDISKISFFSTTGQKIY